MSKSIYEEIFDDLNKKFQTQVNDFEEQFNINLEERVIEERESFEKEITKKVKTDCGKKLIR
jgi:hypothetical protein